jgi:RNA 2',3'-cyclic 3'-phosphodiesterase
MTGTRLFVAVWPSAAVVDSLRNLARPECDAIRWSTPPQWHVTLRFLGSVADVDEVRDALATVDHPAVDVELGPVTKKLGPGVLMLPARGLDSLARALPFELDRPFSGHLTVARAHNRRQVPRSVEGIPFSASWRATSFALVRSQTRPSGAVYDDVATYPLC